LLLEKIAQAASGLKTAPDTSASRALAALITDCATAIKALREL